MCAIAGMVALPNSMELRLKMLSTMRHRGPDGTGWFAEGPCTLLHSRLAIIDLEKGAQPMHLHWDGQWCTISYNGELYNGEELKQELIALGHHFQTYSDTEIVLHAYAQWEADCLNKLNGIFAFAVWENRKQRLFLARDPMGVKPLFFKLHQGGLLFASEIKTILAYPTVCAELDQQGVGELLLLGPGRTPGSGVLRGIQEIEPGCCGYYQGGTLTIKRYWKLLDAPFTDTFDQTVEKVRYLVTDAITRQMVSDVPIGTFLSGGLDSSIITALCAHKVAEQGGCLPTFSLDYMGNDKYFTPEKFQPTSDNDFIRIMQETLQTDHHWAVLAPEALVLSLEDATRARDLPGMADVDFSLLQFCRQIRGHVKVALSGECADEIFGGYPWYRDPQVRALEGFPWAQNTEPRAALLHGAFREKLNAREFVMDRYRQTLIECDILSDASDQEIRMKEMVNLNYRWFMQTLLDRKDRMSMACGLEVRVPFCDRRIAEYLYTVPWEFKDYQGREKGLLRKAMEGILPEEVLYRKKSPYPKTYDPAYEKQVRGMLEILLEEKDAPLWQLVDKKSLLAFLQQETPWPWYGQLMRKPQTMAYLLQLNFWLKSYEISIV